MTRPWYVGYYRHDARGTRASVAVVAFTVVVLGNVLLFAVSESLVARLVAAFAFAVFLFQLIVLLAAMRWQRRQDDRGTQWAVPSDPVA